MFILNNLKLATVWRPCSVFSTSALSKRGFFEPMSAPLKPRRKSVHIFTKLLAEARALYEQSIGIRDDIISKILVQSMQRKMEQHVADVLHS